MASTYEEELIFHQMKKINESKHILDNLDNTTNTSVVNITITDSCLYFLLKRSCLIFKLIWQSEITFIILQKEKHYCRICPTISGIILESSIWSIPPWYPSPSYMGSTNIAIS